MKPSSGGTISSPENASRANTPESGSWNAIRDSWEMPCSPPIMAGMCSPV
jgi:hypothetical protein